MPVNDIIEWDILNWSQLIPLWLPLFDSMSRDATVLALGERNGGLSLMMALLGFRVTCTDRAGPTKKATLLHERYNVAHLIGTAALDIVNDTVVENQYDLVLAKSVIGGLKRDPRDSATRTVEARQTAVDNIHRLLKPGGYSLAAENMQGAPLLQLYRKWRRKDSAWSYLVVDEIMELYRAFSTVHIRTFGLLPTGSSNDVLNRACFWMNKYVLDILPADYKYVSFVKARK